MHACILHKFNFDVYNHGKLYYIDLEKILITITHFINPRRMREGRRRLCGDRADGRVDIEYTNSQVSSRYDELISRQAAKTKEQAATAKELTLRARDSKG